MVRHGHLPEREIMTGVGPVTVRQPRVRDRASGDGERIRYAPAILPRYARRSKSLEVLIPILYLKGISTGDFEEGAVDGRFSVAVATSQRSKPSDGHSTATDLVTNTNRGVQAGRRANLVPWRGHWGNGTLRGWVARDIARGRCELSPNFGDGVKDQAAAWA